MSLDLISDKLCINTTIVNFQLERIATRAWNLREDARENEPWEDRALHGGHRFG